jgi:hypothetical protein
MQRQALASSPSEAVVASGVIARKRRIWHSQAGQRVKRGEANLGLDPPCAMASASVGGMSSTSRRPGKQRRLITSVEQGDVQEGRAAAGEDKKVIKINMDLMLVGRGDEAICGHSC